MLRYAFGAALVVASAFAFISGDIANYKWSILLVAGATYSAFTTGYLLYEVTKREADLGHINHEKSSIVLALVIVFIYLLIEIGTAFTSLKNKDATKPTAATPTTAPTTAANPAGEWIYRKWGVGGDCAIITDITRGPGARELTISAGSARDVRKIIGEPTSSRVETSDGTFLRNPDGSITSSETGMEGLKLTPCDS